MMFSFFSVPFIRNGAIPIYQHQTTPFKLSPEILPEPSHTLNNRKKLFLKYNILLQK